MKLVWVVFPDDYFSLEYRYRNVIYNQFENHFRDADGQCPVGELSTYTWAWLTVNGKSVDEFGEPLGAFLVKHPEGFQPSRPVEGESFTDECVMVVHRSYCEIFPTTGVSEKHISEFVEEWRGFGETVHRCKPVHLLGGNLHRFHVYQWDQNREDWG